MLSSNNLLFSSTISSSVFFLSVISITQTKFAGLYPKILERGAYLENDVIIVRIKHREFMCVLSKFQGLFLCYVFIGKSFSAKQKFSQFIDYFSNSNTIDNLNDFVLKKKNLTLDIRVQLSSLIRQYFL